MEKLKILSLVIFIFLAFATCKEGDVPKNENIVLKVIELKVAEVEETTDHKVPAKPNDQKKCAATKTVEKNKEEESPQVHQVYKNRMKFISSNQPKIHFNISVKDSNGKREICFTLMDLIRMKSGV